MRTAHAPLAFRTYPLALEVARPTERVRVRHLRWRRQRPARLDGMVGMAELGRETGARC